MLNFKPDSNKNCINICDDVYVLESEFSCKLREKTKFIDTKSEKEIPAYNYNCYYYAVFKSVNMGNVLIFRYSFLNENFKINMNEIVDCVERFKNENNADVFYQPTNTIVIEKCDDLSQIFTNIAWDNLPPEKGLHEFVDNLLSSNDMEEIY